MVSLFYMQQKKKTFVPLAFPFHIKKEQGIIH